MHQPTLDLSDAALIVVDVQNDFCPGGALAVPDGDHVIPVVKNWVNTFQAQDRPIIFTGDAHPRDHVSFQERQGLWPAHCVKGTWGAAYHEALEIPHNAFHVEKGFLADVDAYSGFEGLVMGPDGTRTDQSLQSLLDSLHVHTIYLAGLATDYCVKATGLNGLDLGYKVVLIGDAIRGVNVHPNDSNLAVLVLEARGAEII